MVRSHPDKRSDGRWLAPGLTLGCLLLATTALGAASGASRALPGPARSPAQAESQILVTLEQSPAPRLGRAGSTPRSYGGGGRYGASTRSRRATARLARDYGMREIAEWPIAVLDLHCVVFEIPTGTPREILLARLAEDPRVESVQPMQLFRTLTETYDDPYLPLQHGMESMQVRDAHRWAVGKGVRVAVVDSGIDRGHPDLTGRVRVAQDFVDEELGDRPPELHGTAVAGVIASTANNGIGIVGVAPEVRILALKACWEGEGTSAGATCNSFTLAKAIAFAVGRRPEILNLSLEGPPDPLLAQLVGAALERGLVVIAARGDHPGGAPRFPASIPGVIAVGTAGSEGAERAAGEASAELILLAPGTDILTTTPNGSYDFLSGSSFAAAHVSGVAALLMERSPDLTPEGIRRLLEGSARGLESSTGVSAGMVDACAALAEIVPEASCS